MKTWEKNEKDDRFRESIRFGREILKSMAASKEVVGMYICPRRLGDVALMMAMGFDDAVHAEIAEQGKDWANVTDLNTSQVQPKE